MDIQLNDLVTDIAKRLDSIKSVSLQNRRPTTALTRTRTKSGSLVIDGKNESNEVFEYESINLLPIVFTYISLRPNFTGSCIVKERDAYIIYVKQNDQCFIKGKKTFIQECLKNKGILVIVDFSLIDFVGFSGHDNCVIFDTKTKEVERYEPHGSRYSGLGFNDNKINISLSKFLLEEFSEYKYIPPVDYCPVRGFQTLENDSSFPNFDFEKGYCIWWTIAYIEFRIMNKNIKREDLQSEIINFFGKNSKTFDYRHYIRGRIVFFLKMYNYMIKSALNIKNKVLTLGMILEDDEFMNIIINKKPVDPEFLYSRAIESNTFPQNNIIYGDRNSNVYIVKSKNPSFRLDNLIPFRFSRQALITDCRDIEKYNKLRHIYRFDFDNKKELRPMNELRIENLDIYQKVTNWIINLYTQSSSFTDYCDAAYFRYKDIDFIFWINTVKVNIVDNKGTINIF